MGDGERNLGLRVLRIYWVALALFGLPCAASVAWAHSGGDPRSSGLGDVHTHFVVFFLGFVSTVGLAVWLIPALIYAYLHWRKLVWFDFAMLFLSACVAAIILHPGWFF